MSLSRDPALERIYARSRGPVAFVDESHRAPVRPGEVGFYTVAAAIVDRDQLEVLRDGIRGFTRAGLWHTTQEFQAGNLDRIEGLADYVAGAVEWNILAVETPMTGHRAEDYAAARGACLATVMVEVTRGANPVQVVVADTLGTPAADGEDRKVAALLRGSGEIPQGTLLRHSTDELEPLLGAPDVVAWATRRLLAVDDTRWFAHVQDVTTVLDARSGARVDAGRLVAAVPVQSAIAASFPQPAIAAGKALASLVSQVNAAQARQGAARHPGNDPRGRGR